MATKAGHRRSIRLRGYDYSQSNAYFVTICTAKRLPLFGMIVDGVMIASGSGRIVVEEWLKTSEIRTYAKLDRFVLMPNHFHGILFIDRQEGGTARRAPTLERFGEPAVNSLPTIIRAFKSAVSKRINSSRAAPGSPIWQRNYYEHVVRHEKALNRIREYIEHNPQTWELDLENPGRAGEHDFYRWLTTFTPRPGKGMVLKT
jgi:putative transposase